MAVDRFHTRFHVAGPTTPACPDSCGLLLAAACCSFSVTLPWCKSALGKASSNAPLVAYPAADEPRRGHAIIGRGARVHQGPGTQMSAAAVVALSRLRAHAPCILPAVQTGDGARVGLAVARLFAERERSASPHGACPGELTEGPKLREDVDVWRSLGDVCNLAMLIVDAPCTFLVRPCATTSACGFSCPVKRCEAPPSPAF